MSTIENSMRERILDACRKYDLLKGTKTHLGLASWAERYFTYEDDSKRSKSECSSHAARMETDPLYRKGYERRAREAQAGAAREQARIEKMREARNRCNAKAKASVATLTQTNARLRDQVFQLTKLRGKDIGDVWYSELSDMRNASAFEAALAAKLLNHGIPSKPTRMRDFVKASALEAMIGEARIGATP